MNHSEMIERAAVAITDYLDPVREKRHNGQYDEFDYGQACAVVDALLPRVTTVEELEALPVESILLTEGGEVFEKCLPEPFTYWRVMGEAEGLTTNEVRSALPLTVVWQP